MKSNQHITTRLLFVMCTPTSILLAVKIDPIWRDCIVCCWRDEMDVHFTKQTSVEYFTVFPFQLNLPVSAPIQYSAAPTAKCTRILAFTKTNSEVPRNKLWLRISFSLSFFLLPLYTWRITSASVECLANQLVCCFCNVPVLCNLPCCSPILWVCSTK
jgi:hypothetical protein